MSFSSGTFSLVAGNPVVTGTTISSTVQNNTMTDVATGLTTCILKDGTQTTTAAIPFVTGVIAGSTTMAVFNTVATTVNAFGAATTLNLGAATGTATVSNTTLAAKAITASSTITPSSTSGIVGTTTNDNANAGSVGEIMESTVAIGSHVQLTNATAKDIASLTLTPGDWDVTGVLKFDITATTNVTNLLPGTSSGTNALDANEMNYFAQFYPTAGFVNSAQSTPGFVIPTRRVQVASGTQVINLEAYALFTVSTMFAYGYIRGRRVR